MELGAGLIAASRQYAHGDENNADRNGRLPGYAVVNLDAHYDMTPQSSLFALVNNVFDQRYYNFAVLGSNAFTGPGNTFGPALGLEPMAEQFRAVGTPRGISVGLRYRFDQPATRG